MKQLHGVPSSDNKYFIMKSYGGYSPCIMGNNAFGLRPFVGSVLPNCVGGAVGAYNLFIGEGNCNALGSVNAEDFIALAKKQGREISQEPLPGSIMVWACGSTGTGADGAGHVAFVNDKVNGVAKTWESGWSYQKSVVEELSRSKGNGNWGQGSKYRYLGSILHPNIDPYRTPTVSVIKKGMSGDAVRWLQWVLVAEKCYLVNNKSQIDGHFGNNTFVALKKFQKLYGLDPDGYGGPATQAKIRQLHTLEGVY